MLDNTGNIFLLNNSPFHSDYTDMDIPDTDVFYEVIRIISGIPLFLEDHYMRLRSSLKILDLKLDIALEQLEDMIHSLTSVNDKNNCNVKLLVFYKDNRLNFLLYISRSYYPSEMEYSNGVPVSIMYRSRSNPNAKIADSRYKEAVTEKIKHDNVFEVLLVNDQGFLTEGSRSNLFFVNKTSVVTAPDSFVLKGVTRKYVIAACRDAGFGITEKLVTPGELKDMEGLFLSGTSIKVLPVSSVGSAGFASAENPMIRAIGSSFDKILDNYIEARLK